MEIVNLNIYGIDVQLITSITDFAEVIKNNYLLFINDYPSKNLRIQVNYSQEAGNIAKSHKENLLRIGEGLYFLEPILYWENEFGFSISVDITCKHRWKINAFHFDLLNIQSLEERYKNFTRSMRWAIHFPVFSVLEREQNKQLVHAAAVTKDDISLIFCGLNKVGKSSIALYFVEKLGYNFLTDNFLLTDGKWIYAFPEMCRISHEATDYLNIKVPNKQLIYSKYHLNLVKKNMVTKMKPTHVFFVTNSHENKINLIRRNQLLALLGGLHNYLIEFPRYTFYSILSYVGLGPINNPSENLFPEDINYYWLNHKLDWKLNEIAEDILANVY